jgi:hypothetical protein
VQQKDDTDEFIQLLKVSQGQAPPAEAAPPEGSQLNLNRSTTAPRQ